MGCRAPEALPTPQSFLEPKEARLGQPPAPAQVSKGHVSCLTGVSRCTWPRGGLRALQVALGRCPVWVPLWGWGQLPGHRQGYANARPAAGGSQVPPPQTGAGLRTTSRPAPSEDPWGTATPSPKCLLSCHGLQPGPWLLRGQTAARHSCLVHTRCPDSTLQGTQVASTGREDAIRSPGGEGQVSGWGRSLWWATVPPGPAQGRVLPGQSLGFFSGHSPFLRHRRLPSCPHSIGQDGAAATPPPPP